MGFLDLTKETFGLDITDLSVKIIKLKKSGEVYYLSSYNRIDLKPGIVENGIIKDEKLLAKIIRNACDGVKGKKLKTKYVVASLPEEKSFLQVIQMPRMTDDELKSAVPFQAENYIPLSIKDVYLDFQVVPQKKESADFLDVLIVAMPKKIIDSYVSCLKTAGLIPVAFEIESEAIVRAMLKKENEDSCLAIIDLGKSDSDFIVFSGRSIRFTFSIPVSSQKITNAIAEKFRIDFEKAEKLKIEYGLSEKLRTGRDYQSIFMREEAKKVHEAIEPILEELADQIKKYINFYYDHSTFEHLHTPGKIEKILICGGGSKLHGLPEFLSRSTGIPVEIGSPAQGISLRKSKDPFGKESLSFVTALGLALRGECDKKSNI